MGMFTENYSGNRCSDCTWADNAEKKIAALKTIEEKLTAHNTTKATIALRLKELRDDIEVNMSHSDMEYIKRELNAVIAQL